jgi:hypothetical protein
MRDIMLALVINVTRPFQGVNHPEILLLDIGQVSLRLSFEVSPHEVLYFLKLFSKAHFEDARLLLT